MDNLVDNIARQLQKEMNLTNDKKEEVAYGIYMFINIVSGFAAIIIVSWLLGVLKLGLIAAITTSTLRVISGGAHSKCLRNCVLLGAVLSPGFGLAAQKIGPVIPDLYLLLFSAATLFYAIWVVFRYVPADTPNKPIRSDSDKKRFRMMSFMWLSVWVVIFVLGFVFELGFSVSAGALLASTLGLLWQAFSLTPQGYKTVDLFDRLLP